MESMTVYSKRGEYLNEYCQFMRIERHNDDYFELIVRGRETAVEVGRIRYPGPVVSIRLSRADMQDLMSAIPQGLLKDSNIVPPKPDGLTRDTRSMPGVYVRELDG